MLLEFIRFREMVEFGSVEAYSSSMRRHDKRLKYYVKSTFLLGGCDLCPTQAAQSCWIAGRPQLQGHAR